MISAAATPKISLPQYGGDVVGLGDIHVPFQDAKWIEKVYGLAKIWDINVCAWVGDILDGNGATSYNDAIIPISKEIRDYKKFEEESLAYFDKILWTRGNHEERYFKRSHTMPDGHSTGEFKTLKQIIDEYFIEDSKVTFYDSAILKVKIGNQKWHFEHPARANEYAATVAGELATKLQTNVATWHTHRQGFRYDITGKYLGIDVGAAASFNRMPYILFKTFGKNTMNTGALILKKDGSQTDVHILTPKTNFTRLEKFYG